MPIIAEEELQAAFDGPVGPTLPRALWMRRLLNGTAPALPLAVLCEIASEEDPRGPLATVQALLEWLLAKHADKDATCTALMAIAELHLPAALDAAQCRD